MDILKRNAIEISGLKNIVTKFNIIEGSNIRLGTANSRVNEVEDRWVKNVHTKVCREKKE